MLSLKQFLQVLDAYCTERAMPYAYARRYDDTLFETPHRDVDIVVAKDRIAELETLLQACPGLTSVRRVDHSTNTQFYVHGIRQQDLGFFCLDVHHALAYKGIPYLNVSAVLLRTQPSPCGIGREPYILDMALIYLFTHLLKHGTVSPTVRLVLNEAYRQARNPFKALLNLYFGLAADRRLQQVLEKPGNQHLVRSLRRGYWGSAWKRHAVMVPVWYTAFVFGTLWQRCFKRGDVRVAVVGTDGSGKSTLIKAITPGLHNLCPRIVQARVVPSVPWRPQSDPEAVVANPHARGDRSWLVSNIKLFYFFGLAWLDAVWPRRGGRVVLYDRYVTDVLIDPRRFRFGGSFDLARFLLRHMPPVHAFIWIATPAAVAYSRKPELSVAEMHRQYQAYQAMCASDKRCIIVDQNSSPDDVIEKLVRLLGQQSC